MMRKKVAKIAILVVADVATLYLSGAIAKWLLGFMNVQMAFMEPGNIVVILTKIAVFAACLLYSTSEFRNLMWDAAGVVAANVAGAVITFLTVPDISISQHYLYFIIVFVEEALLCVIFRYLIRSIGVSDEYYDDEYEADAPPPAIGSSEYYTGAYQRQPGRVTGAERPKAIAQDVDSTLINSDPYSQIKPARTAPHREARAPQAQIQAQAKAQPQPAPEARVQSPFAGVYPGASSPERIGLGVDPYDAIFGKTESDLRRTSDPDADDGEDMYATLYAGTASLKDPESRRDLEAKNSKLAEEYSKEQELRVEIEEELRKTRGLLAKREAESMDGDASSESGNPEPMELMQKSIQDALAEVRKEKEESLAVLLSALEEKESRIASLEKQMDEEVRNVSEFLSGQRAQAGQEQPYFGQDAYYMPEADVQDAPYDDYTSDTYSDVYASQFTGPDQAYAQIPGRTVPAEIPLVSANLDPNPSIHRQEVLDKILEDVRSLYNQLNSRTRMLEEKENNMLNRMLEFNGMEIEQRATQEKKKTTRRSKRATAELSRRDEPARLTAPLEEADPQPPQVSQEKSPLSFVTDPFLETSSVADSIVSDALGLTPALPPPSEDPILIAEEESLRQLEEQNRLLDEQRRQLEDYNRRLAQERELEEQKKRIAYMKQQEARNRKLAEIEDRKKATELQNQQLQQQIAQAQQLAKQFEASRQNQPPAQQQPAAPAARPASAAPAPQDRPLRQQPSAGPASVEQVRRYPAAASASQLANQRTSRAYVVASAAPPATIPLPALSNVLGTIAAATPGQATGQLGALVKPQNPLHVAARPAPASPQAQRTASPRSASASSMRTDFSTAQRRRPDGVPSANYAQSQKTSALSGLSPNDTARQEPQRQPAGPEQQLQEAMRAAEQAQSGALREKLKNAEGRSSLSESAARSSETYPRNVARTGALPRVERPAAENQRPSAPPAPARPIRSRVDFQELSHNNIPLSGNEIDSLSKLIDDI